MDMAAHMLAEVDPSFAPRVRLSGPNYRGHHRSAIQRLVGEPGALVLEPASDVPSSVIVQIDAVTALVRHVGTCDDHPVLLAALRPFADGARVRVGADFGDSR
jgi:hypothetical protein